VHSKGGVLLGFAGVLVGLSIDKLPGVLGQVATGVAGVTAMVAAAIVPRSYQTLSLRRLRDRYLTSEEEFTRLRVLDMRIAMYDRTQQPLAVKALLVRLAAVGLRHLDQLTEHALTRAWAAGAGPGDAGVHRRGLHHHRGPRPRQAGRQLWLHPPAGLLPAAGRPCGHRRGAAHPPARLGAHTARGMVRFVDGDGFCSQLARDGDTRQVVYASLVARVASDPVFGGVASGGSGEVSGGSGGRPYPGPSGSGGRNRAWRRGIARWRLRA
jgi:hypothetical protein